MSMHQTEQKTEGEWAMDQEVLMSFNVAGIVRIKMYAVGVGRESRESRKQFTSRS